MKEKRLLKVMAGVSVAIGLVFVTAQPVLAAENVEAVYDNFKEIDSTISSNGQTLLVESIQEQDGQYYVSYSTTNSAGTKAPRIIYSYEKQVVNNYSDFGAIPESISYREYNNQYSAWFSGTLTISSLTRIGTSYSVTYKGTLTGSI